MATNFYHFHKPINIDILLDITLTTLTTFACEQSIRLPLVDVEIPIRRIWRDSGSVYTT